MPLPLPDAPPEPGPTSAICDNAALRNAWYAVARVPDVGVYPVPVVLLGTKVVLYRTSSGPVIAALTARHRCRRASSATAASSAPTTAGRSARAARA